MVIANGVHGTRKLLLLGLTEENVQRLRAGMPIRVTPETHPGCPDGLEINIVHGLNALTIADDLLRRDLLEDDARIIMVSREPRERM